MKILFSIFKSILLFLFLFIICLCKYSTKWVLTNYNNISIDELLFHLLGPLQGTETSLLTSYFKDSFLISLILSFVIFLVLIIIFKFFKSSNFIIDYKLWKKKKKFIIKGTIINLFILLLILIISILQIDDCLRKLNFYDYLKNQKFNSTFIEDNYISLENINLTFPQQKRNLIYIFVESLEGTYFSKKLGGGQDYNLMPELEKLSNEYINFSNTDKLGGALPISGTGWTTAGMVAQTAGIPLKIDGQLINNVQMSSLLPGANAIGQILEDAGYNQVLMFGSDAVFGNKKIYFENHGNYTIYDYQYAIDSGKLPEDYYVWWGYEDSKLFEYAKDEILNLSQQDIPFNFTMLTSNTHHVNGYLDSDCDVEYDDQYSNVIACTSKQLSEFIKWIQNQDFYENTTIVISGDHLSMASDYFNDLDENYQRNIFNLFINSVAKTENTINRQFSTLDLYPTTLASLGIEIEGNKLALGVNLFSNEKTLIEQYGYECVNNELEYKSDYYNNKFIYKYNMKK